MHHFSLTLKGLPKAAIVTHERVWAASFVQAACGSTSEDIFYINLPLYHSAGFLIGLAGGIERGNDPQKPHECGSGSIHTFTQFLQLIRWCGGLCNVILIAGMTLVLRRKFSASQFWDDCRKYNVTVIQYIGETMRYLCNTPKVMQTDVCLNELYRPDAYLRCWELALISPSAERQRQGPQSEDRHWQRSPVRRLDRFSESVWWH